MEIKFLVNSHINYIGKTFDKIIPSLLESGIDPALIYVIVTQGKENKKIDNKYNVNLYEVDHNSYDIHATFLSVFELGLLSDYWFFLHDTCVVEKKFYQKIKEFDYSPEYDIITACGGSTTMNLANYKHSFIKKFEPTLVKEKNKDFSLEKMKIIKKDFSIHRENMFALKEKIDCYKGDINIDLNSIKIGSYSNPCNKNAIQMGLFDYYGTGVLRLKLYFEDLGIYKYSANYGQNPHESLNHVINL